LSTIFRILALLCLASIVVLSVFSYFGKVGIEFFALASGIIAVLASALEILSSKPIGKGDVSVAVDKVLLTYDEDTLRALKEAKEEEQQIRAFVEHRSNEIFLLKMRAYLEEAIISKYRDSEIAKLVAELEQVETQLDSMNVQYGSIELPERFKDLLNRLNEEERFNAYIELLDAFPDLPLFPIKRMYIAAMRLSFAHRHQILQVLRRIRSNEEQVE
jgi:hypothetical protein